MKLIINVFLRWLPLAAAITILSGTIYVAVEQVYRMNANDPQIQMAHDAAQALEDGKFLEQLLPEHRDAEIDITRSLAPYWAMYDDDGELMDSDTLPDTPLLYDLPRGMFEYARQHGEDRVTWEPLPGVRSAVVLVHAGGKLGGFILAGRSLREVEARVDQLSVLVGAGWITALVVSFIAAMVCGWIYRSSSYNH
jgi:hypothetical protein